MTPPPATVTLPSVCPRQWPDVSPAFRTSWQELFLKQLCHPTISRLASGSPSPRPKALRLLAHPFLHTSVMTLVIAVMFFSRK